MIDIFSIIERAKLALNLRTDSELARKLEIKPSAISMWKQRGSIDLISLLNLCPNVSSDWLIYGNKSDSYEFELKNTIDKMLKQFNKNELKKIELLLSEMLETKQLKNRLSELESKIEVK